MTLDELKQFWGEPTLKAELRKARYMLAIGAVLGMLAPYESDQHISVTIRFLYWIGLMMVPTVLSGPFARWMFGYFERWQLAPWKALLVYSFVISVPVWPIVGLADTIATRQYPLSIGVVLETLFPTGSTPLDLLIWFLQVVLISALAVGSASVMQHFGAKTNFGPHHAPVAPTTPKRGEAFLKRLPAALGQDLMCLSMEDHYVRVFTRLGDTLLLMRLKDAAAELADYPGLQIHRSHWVASDAIVSVEREGRRYLVHLADGQVLPVSRSYIQHLKDKGMA